MKQFEVTVVRSYTTTISFHTENNVTDEDIKNAILGDGHPELRTELWESLAEAELNQCDTELLKEEVKEIKPTK